MKIGLFFSLLFLGVGLSLKADAGLKSSKLLLKENWQIQSSVEIRENGAEISLADYQPRGWYLTKIPATVLAVLVKNKGYPDLITERI